VFDISNNLILLGLAGGAGVTSTVAGTMSGNTFTTTSVSVGPIFSGAQILCGAAPNQVTGMLQYPGSTGTTPAGGGGGNSGYNQSSDEHDPKSNLNLAHDMVV
jgi:hypothetical protein